MTPEEKAREMVEQWHGLDAPLLVKEIASAIRAAEDEAYERAAAMLDRNGMHSAAAEAIRKLKQKSGPPADPT